MTAAETAHLIDLNDAAVNTLRAYCRANGYDASALYAGECARIDANGYDLATYLRASRAGSPFRLTRSMRRAVFTIKATRAALR